MTLVQLRAFLAAASTGSFTGAAAALGMAQASLSELVRRLEAEVGAALFVRAGRRLALTAAGAELLAHAERAVAAADAGARAVADLGALAGGTASFGLLRNADHYRLGGLVAAFCERHPAVRARFVGLNSVDVAAAVAAGALEAGLVVLPVDDDGLAVTPLLRDEVLLVSADPARAAPPDGVVDVAHLAAAPLVLYDAHHGWRDPTRRQLAARAQLAGVRLQARVEVEQVESALALVARGLGDTVVARALADGPAFPAGLATAPFTDPLVDTVALVQRAGAVLSPATAEIVRLARAVLAALPGSLAPAA